MLPGYPTKNGTGISIFGDYGDLNSLYSTVHEIANSLDEYNERLKAQHQLLMNFAYEIRKASSCKRITDKLIYKVDLKEMQYIGEDTDLKFTVAGRKWINCDGHINFPDGEVFTGPVEDSVEGTSRCTYPGIFKGQDIESIARRFSIGNGIEGKSAND